MRPSDSAWAGRQTSEPARATAPATAPKGQRTLFGAKAGVAFTQISGIICNIDLIGLTENLSPNSRKRTLTSRHYADKLRHWLIIAKHCKGRFAVSIVVLIQRKNTNSYPNGFAWSPAGMLQIGTKAADILVATHSFNPAAKFAACGAAARQPPKVAGHQL